MAWLGKRKKVRGKSIHSPLGGYKIPTQLPEDRLLYLVTQLRAGLATQEEKDELYKGHIRLAIEITARYAGYVPNQIDDLVSEAMIGVAYGINKAQEKLIDNNVTSWITSNVHRFVHDYITRLPTVRIPKNTLTRSKETIVLPKTRHYAKLESKEPSNNNHYDPEYTAPKQIRKGRNTLRTVYHTEEPLQKIRESLEAAIAEEINFKRRKMKSIIMRLRIDGYNDREIAEIMNVSTGYINQMRSDVEQAYIRIEAEG